MSYYIHNTHPTIQPFNGSQARFDTLEEANMVLQAHLNFLETRGFRVREQMVYNDPPEAEAYFITPPASESDQRGWQEQIRSLPVKNITRNSLELQRAISDAAFELLIVLHDSPTAERVDIVRFEVVFPPDEAPHPYATDPKSIWGIPVRVRYAGDEINGKSFSVQAIIKLNEE